ncbi:mannitol dehydrogenase family protein [Aquipuribacter nitratireducens]|uniref:Mannitol-1-phosphate 5-dehydrogenase n=1 Tax=Aquipuribacter nitratireducens TaxID=650104 RepID=A0ABW0GPV6_9MICO
MTRLHRTGVDQLDPRVGVPTYSTADVRTGIVHLGVGGFHRSHMAVYLDDLFTLGLSRDWAVTGLGLLPQDSTMRDALLPQGCAYTVMTKSADGAVSARVVGSLVDYVFVPEQPEAAREVLTDPRTRIVSLTITEGGYHVDQNSGDLVVDEALARDLDALRTGGHPATAFGLIVDALARRRDAGTAPFTVMSCDNIQGNGALTRRAVTAFARLLDPDLAAWVDAAVAFPSSMVDRITPATTDADRTRLADELGVEDAWPVVCEPFRQWVLEDHFPTGRPLLEEVGVQLVPDVHPYELMKLRLLNAGHQAVAYLGRLSGFTYVHEVAQDPLFARFLAGFMEHEASPTLAPVPGVDLPRYREDLLARFANAHVRDTLERLCLDTSDRIPTFLLPVVRDQLASGGPLHRAALVVAAWARYAEGVGEDGAPFEVVDQRREQVMARARRARTDPLAFLEDARLFGDLRDSERFTTAYREALASLREVGARASVEAWADAG